MCFFFNTGVQHQLDSITETECDRNMKISCNICCNRGYNMRCDQCPIASANEQQKAAILDARKIERARRQRVLKEQQKIKELISSATEIYADVKVPSDIERASADLEKLADAFLMLKGGEIILCQF